MKAADAGAQNPDGDDGNIYQNGAVDGHHSDGSTNLAKGGKPAATGDGFAGFGVGYADMHPPLGAGGARGEHDYDHDHPDGDK